MLTVSFCDLAISMKEHETTTPKQPAPGSGPRCNHEAPRRQKNVVIILSLN